MFGFLRFRRANLFMWAIAWWLGGYLLFRFGFTAPIPSSVISIYMGIVSIALLAFVSSSEERREEVSRPLLRLMTEKRFAPLLGGLVVAIPALAAANVYVQMNVPIEPPFFPRTVHPASPPEITVHDKKIAIETGDSPFRQLETSNPEEFRKHVENGRRVYYQNCVFCHGDNMGGNGMFVHGLDPIPTNFADGDTIANLRETFLFWRAAKGGPGTAGRGRPVGFGHAGLGEDAEGRRDSGTPSSSSTISPARGLAPWRPTSDLPPDVARVRRCPVRRVVCLADGPDGNAAARAGSRHRHRGAAGVGQGPLCQVLFAVPRREGGR